MLGGDETYYGRPLLPWLWRRPRTWRPARHSVRQNPGVQWEKGKR